jgi:hypothetical protein
MVTTKGSVQRLGLGTLKTDQIVLAGSAIAATALEINSVCQKSGKTGTFTANGTTPVTVANANITADSIVLITLKTVGGTVGAIPRCVTITPGVGFNVNCTASDTSVYNYRIIN